MVKPRLATLPNVTMFASGFFRGRRWRLRDLSTIAVNVRRLADYHSIPVCLGHEEPGQQSFLERTDLPAAGWVDPRSVVVKPFWSPVTRCWEGRLTGTVTDVAPPIAHLIRSKAFRHVSAEIYDDFTDNYGRHYSYALRRLALLGAECPQVKGMGSLPMPVYSHSERRRPVLYGGPRYVSCAESRSGSFVLTFSEVEATAVLDRQTLVQALAAAFPSLSDSWADGIPDDKLAELVKATNPPDDDTGDSATAPAGGGAGGNFGDGLDPADMARDRDAARKFAESLPENTLRKFGHKSVRSFVNEFSEMQKKSAAGAREVAAGYRRALAGKV